MAAGGVRSPRSRPGPVGLDQAAAGGGGPSRSTCAARCSTRWCARRRRRRRASSLIWARPRPRLLRDGERFDGVVVRDRDGAETELRARARGRRRRPRLPDRGDGRGQGKGPAPRPLRLRRLLRRASCPSARPTARSGSSTPSSAAAFPTDSELVFYAAMPTKDRLPEFKRDPTEALVNFVADLPDAPPIRDGAPGRNVLGKIEMPNRVRGRDRPRPGPGRRRGAGHRPPLRRRLRLGVPVGRMARRLGRAGAARRGVAGARPEALPPPATQRKLRGHAFMIHDYATGRRMNAGRSGSSSPPPPATPRSRRPSTSSRRARSARPRCSPRPCRGRSSSTLGTRCAPAPARWHRPPPAARAAVG